MSGDETRQAIAAFVDAWRALSVPRMVTMLHDTAVWIPPESASFDKKNGSAAVAAGHIDVPGAVMDMSTFRVELHRLTVEDTKGVAEISLSAKTKDGRHYDSAYCFVYQVEDGRIREIIEYSDTLNAWRTFRSGNDR
jgi:uncharacterized protein